MYEMLEDFGDSENDITASGEMHNLALIVRCFGKTNLEIVSKPIQTISTSNSSEKFFSVSSSGFNSLDSLLTI